MNSNKNSNARTAGFATATATRAIRAARLPLATVPALLAVTLAMTSCGGSGAANTSAVTASARGTGAANATTTGPTTTGTATGSASTGTTTAQSTTGGSTRTAPAPAFVEHGGSSGGSNSGSQSEGLAQAVAVVKAHGFTPNETSQYHPNQTLRVMVGTRTGSNDGYDQQAFFFVDGSYIGTDASTPSAGITVVSEGDTEVTLGYRLYRPGDPLCCARGGQADVRFQLDNGRLVALDPIPPVNSSSAPSRQ